MMRTRLVVLGLLVLLGIGGLLAVRTRSRSKMAQPTNTTAARPTAVPAQTASSLPLQRQLAIDIRKNGVTADRARLLFSMVVGPLPGVSVAAEGRDPSDFDGTLAVGYIYEVWSSLTPEQQKAATNLIMGKSVAAPPSASMRPLPVLPLASFLLFASDTPAYDYKTLGKNADGTLAAFLNVAPLQFDITVEYGTPQGTEYAHTWSWTWGNVVGWDKGCHITVWNQKFQALDENDAEAVVTHEMFHCFQQRTAQTAAAWTTVSAWVLEGEATWAMSTVVPAAVSTGIFEGKWNLYVFGPKTVYSDRAYDAIGVYGHLGDLSGSQAVWPKLLPMVLAGMGNDDSAAFKLLIQGNESQYYTSWGSSYFEVTGNTQWAMLSPGSPPTSGPAPDSISVEAGTEEALTPVGPYQAGLFQLSGGADVVVVALLTGYGRLHDQGFAIDTALDASGPLALCLKQGGCSCPDGTPGASLITKGAIAPLSVGIDGGDTTAQVGVVGRSLDEFCKKPEKKPEPTQPSGGGGGGAGGGGGGGDDKPPDPGNPPDGGSSFGDTHLITFDGLLYDLQVVGEYTLVRSTKDDFVVQVRQVPVLGPKVASVNQAMATRIGGQRVSLTMENGVAVLRIDGKVISGAPPKPTSGSIMGAITAYGNTYRFTWPDGTIVRAEQLGKYAMNVRVKPAAARRGALVGLLGDDDGSQENDLVGENNVKLHLNFGRDEINHSLANAWRVKKETSLFDYQPGQSTTTFIDPTFPAKDDAARLSNRADAEKVCREDGVTDPHLLDDCILDLAVTNSFVFGSQYVHAQHVLAARAALSRPAKAGHELATLILKGEILDSKSEPEFHFDANKDDVIWIHDPDCSDSIGQYHPVFLSLFDPFGKPVGGFGQGCQFGRRELPATGSYTLKANFQYRGEITRYRIPIRFVRPNHRQSVAYGQMVSGNIEQRAARDIYTWTAHAGDLIVLSGEGCDLGWMGTDIIDPEGHDFLGPSCRVGTDYKVSENGTYQLIVNSLDSPSPGPYHFVFQGGKLAK
jgi:von Willebrand factor type D domain